MINCPFAAYGSEGWRKSFTKYITLYTGLPQDITINLLLQVPAKQGTDNFPFVRTTNPLSTTFSKVDPAQNQLIYSISCILHALG